MVEQNALEALSVSARAYVLVQGRPEREGRAAELAADPTVRDLFLGGKARLCSGVERGNGGRRMKRICIGRRAALAGGVAALASPAVLRAQTDPIKLATLTPLTGAGGSYGPVMAKVAAAVVEEVNKAGGVLGRKVVLVSEDDQTSPEAGRACGAQADRRRQGRGHHGHLGLVGDHGGGAALLGEQDLPLHRVGRRFDHAAAASGLPDPHPAQLHAAGDAGRRVHPVAGGQEGLHHDPADAVHPVDLRHPERRAAQGRRHAPEPDLRRQEDDLPHRGRPGAAHQPRRHPVPTATRPTRSCC